MSRVDRDRVPEALVAAGILPETSRGAAAEALSGEGAGETSPWYIQGLLVAGAWLAAILFTVFFFGSLLAGVRNEFVHLVVGLLVCGGSAWLMRTRPSARFLVQFALALGIAGQILFGYGFGSLAKDLFAAALAVAVINTAVIPLARQRLQTFLSVVLASGALLTALWDLRWWRGVNLLILLLAAGVVVLWEIRPWYAHRQWRSAGYALVASCLGVLHLSLLPGFDLYRHWREDASWWISTAGLLVLLALMIVRVSDGLGLARCSRPVLMLLGGAGILAVTAHDSPGILGALLVLALGYRRGDRFLGGLATVFLAVFLSAFYYHMDLTLLEKSAALAASGTVLLLFGFVLRRTAPAGEAADA